MTLEGGETLAGSARQQATDPGRYPAPRPSAPRLPPARAGAAGRRSPRLAPGRGPRALPRPPGSRHRALLRDRRAGLWPEGIRDLGSGDLADLAAFAGAAGREGATSSASTRCTPSSSRHRRTAAPTPPRTGASSTGSTSPPTSCRRWPRTRGCAPPSTPPTPSCTGTTRTRRLPGRGRPPPPAARGRLRRLPRAAPDLAPYAARPRLPRLPARLGRGAGAARHLRGAARASLPGTKGCRLAGDWPEALRDPRRPDVASLRAAHADRVELLHAWLQWHADRQLAEAAAAGRGRRAARSGSTATSRSGSTAPAPTPGPTRSGRAAAPRSARRPTARPARARTGACRRSTRWRCAARASQPSGSLHRAPTCATPARCASTTSMGLMRLYWIPTGAPAADGAYVALPVRRPAGDPARWKATATAALVIGEDLGTVPAGFRDALMQAGMLSYRLLYFERDARRRLPAARATTRAGAVGLDQHPRPADPQGLVATATTSTGAERLELFYERTGRPTRRAPPSGGTEQRLVRTLRRAACSDRARPRAPRRSRSPSTATWPGRERAAAGAARGRPAHAPSSRTCRARSTRTRTGAAARPRPRRRRCALGPSQARRRASRP